MRDYIKRVVDISFKLNRKLCFALEFEVKVQEKYEYYQKNWKNKQIFRSAITMYHKCNSQQRLTELFFNKQAPKNK